MENATMTGRADAPTTYDYRMYDRIWQRVSPDLDPYPEVRAAQSGGTAGTDPAYGMGSAGVSPSTGIGSAGMNSAGMGSTGMNSAGMNSAGVGSTGMGSTGMNSTGMGSTGMSPAGMGSMGMSTAGMAAVPAPALENGGANLPGAEENPCCMGSEAQASVEVIAGFIDEELAECRCCMSLSRQVRNQSAARLFRRIAAEKQAAARDLRAAYYLITGTCYAPVITMERRQWRCLTDILRSCYHQEACNGFNYQRAADEATDQCLQNLLNRLGMDAYRRAEDVLDLLGKVIR